MKKVPSPLNLEKPENKENDENLTSLVPRRQNRNGEKVPQPWGNVPGFRSSQAVLRPLSQATFNYPPPGYPSFQLPYIPDTPPFSPVSVYSNNSSLSSFPFSPVSPIPQNSDVFNFSDVPCRAFVDEGGWISLPLKFDVRVDIAPEGTLRILNPAQNSSLAVSRCFTQMTAIHPQGRVLRYGPRIEVQIEDFVSVKNSKIHPRGVSFTANNCALVYLVDEAGVRTTSDTFHDLYRTEIVDNLFLEGGSSSANGGMEVCAWLLQEAKYWRDPASDTDHWQVGGLRLRQTRDGFLIVTREGQEGESSRSIVTVSPANGKLKYVSGEVTVTASQGTEAHLFLRSTEKRVHYSGQEGVLAVRNAGHAAGFDERGILNIH